MRTTLILLFLLVSIGKNSLPGNRPISSTPFVINKKVAFNLSVNLAPDLQKKHSNIDTAELKKSNWYSEAIKNIEESEYEIRYDKSTHSYASPNRKQNLRSFYTGDRFTLLPRNDSVDKWKLTLQLKGVYAGKQKLYAASNNPAATQNGNNIQFNHNNQFITEYVNSKEGVRQNFIITRQPAGNPKKIKVELESNKGWFINKMHDKEIHFAKATKDGYDKKITYNDLKAWDVSGKELQAAFVITKNTISIDVNTSNAVYPVTIDPLSTGTAGTPDWIAGDANLAYAYFGSSVASAGDVNGDGYSDVIIGAYGFNLVNGRVFVYLGSVTGLSTTPSNDFGASAGDNLGGSVGSAGDINGDGFSDVIVGADGKAFVHYGSAAGLSNTPGNILSVMGASSFGFSVASAGDVNGDGYSDVIIGADAQNKTFVYHGSPTGLPNTPNRILTESSDFGFSVASAGDVNGDGYSDVIIGAIAYNSNEGRAFVYHGSASGLPVSPNSIFDDADQLNASFGWSVASAGDINGDGYSDVIVGAHNYDDGANTKEGRAFVHYGSAAGLSTTPNRILDDTDQAFAHFGTSVACAGDVNGDGYSDIIIGAYSYTGSHFAEGRAFVYYGSVTGLSTAPISTPDDADQNNAYFGTSVASAGDVNGDGYSDVIIGAAEYDDSGNNEEGRAFVYHGSPGGLVNTAQTQLEGNQINAQFGQSVATAGDVNGDGYSDVVIGAWQYDNGENDEGAVFVYHGSATGINSVAATVIEGNQISAAMGYWVASAGDVNGDGYDDLIASTPYYDNGQTNEGAAFIYHGSAGGLNPVAVTILESNQVEAQLGRVSCAAGDINGDGYGDIVVGAWFYDNGQTDEGAAFIYYGSPIGINSIPATLLENDQASSWLGGFVASAGDVNGDGYGDIIVSAAYYDNGQTDEGIFYVYHGSATGINLVPAAMAESNQANAHMGFATASAGDVNGDGFGDIVVSAYLYDNPETNEGAAYVYLGSATGINLVPAMTFETNQANATILSVSSAGDINGDGYSDVAIGSFLYDNGQSNEGVVFIFTGSSSGISNIPASTLEINQAGAFFGGSVACAGDVNGDGYSDILAGAYLYDNSEADEGAAFTYYGNNSGGLRNNLRLYNQDLVTPIQQSSIAPALFGAGLYAKSPLGRQKGKLVWETVKNGQPFSGNPITNSTAYLSQQPAYTDLGLAGTELKHQIAKQFNSRVTYIRARVKYDPVTAITGQVYGPWRYPESFLRGNRDIGAVALPVKFISFAALKQNDNVLLKWITADETPGIHYEVQHSIDGMNFRTIKYVAGFGGSHNEYDWLHSNPSTGRNFYRIHTVENNKDVFTAIRQINFDMSTGLVIYPNPAKSQSPLTIALAGGQVSGTMSLELFSITGRNPHSPHFGVRATQI